MTDDAERAGTAPEGAPADAAEAVKAVRRAKSAEGTTPPPAEASPPDDEMGGEAPCQLHRFWDVEE